jgi:ABC-type lipoprotein release transport system permease subunit
MPLNVRIGFYLALRQLRRASLWTTGLIIFVMVLTFLNLVVISGILVGLLQGAVDAVRTEYTSDILISTLSDKSYIENSPNLIALVRATPGVAAATPRYIETSTLEANYQTRKESDKPNTAPAQIIGIDPAQEDAVTGIGKYIIEGSFLQPGDYDKIVLGNYLLSQYIPVATPGLATLDHVGIGAKIRIRVGGVLREVMVKGILKSKVDEIALRAFMVDSQFRSIIGRTDGNVDEIAVKLQPGADPIAVKNSLVLRGADQNADIRTFEEAQPKAFKDIINTFGMLGTMFSSIGLVVASVTIFIVIFVNALTRRKFIGILKGIGIHGRAIEYSYVFQSVFYATAGSLVGLALVYGFLVPYFLAHPIDFPFSDGILVAPIDQTMVRIALLMCATVVAGYIPAWMIIRKNTLDSILGRN